jgi:hypothetical protein
MVMARTMGVVAWLAILTACGASDGDSTLDSATTETLSPAAVESAVTTASTVEVTTTETATPTSVVDEDPWVTAVTNARYPIAVAYGLPDDYALAGSLLGRSFERKRGACMGHAGFDYRPELAEDPAAPLDNSTKQSALPLEERLRYNTVYDSCSEEAAAQTFLVAAVCGTSRSCPDPQNPVPTSHTDQRRAEIDFILSHRETLETLVANLDYT